MKRTLILCISVLLTAVALSAPKPINSETAAKVIAEADAEAAAYAQLAAEIRAAQNFQDLQTRLAAWADAQKQRVKDKKSLKVKK